LNNKILSTKNTSAIFLATVLVLGTIATISPSFMVGAQAQEYYGMERDYKKSDKKDVSVNSIKCNNVNVNVNGLELNLSSVPFLSGLLASEANEGQTGASSYGSGSGSYGDKSRSDGDFKFVCINNNNNTVVVPPPVPPVPETCEECFNTILTEAELDDLIQAIEEDSEGIVSSLEELCEVFTENVQDELFRAGISERLFTLGGNVGISEDKINEILDCLEEVFDEDFPREIIIM
jgi:hypothetical protein